MVLGILSLIKGNYPGVLNMYRTTGMLLITKRHTQNIHCRQPQHVNLLKIKILTMYKIHSCFNEVRGEWPD